MLDNVLYFIWGAIPAFFFLMALWSWLEKVGGKKRQERPEDFLRQGFFVLGCVIMAFIIEAHVLKDLVAMVPYANTAPYGIYQVVLLPFLLYAASKIVGPTKDIKIDKAPKTGNRHK